MHCSSRVALTMQPAGDVLHFLHVVPHHASGNAFAPQTEQQEELMVRWQLKHLTVHHSFQPEAISSKGAQDGLQLRLGSGDSVPTATMLAQHWLATARHADICPQLRIHLLMSWRPCVASQCSHTRLAGSSASSFCLCTRVCLSAGPLHAVSRLPLCIDPALRRLLLPADLALPPLLQREHAKTWIQERFAPIIASVKVGSLPLHRAVCLGCPIHTRSMGSFSKIVQQAVQASTECGN